MTNANKILVLSLFLVFSCEYRSEKDMMCGIWNYTQVSKGDSSLFEVNSEDLMILGNDSSFTYDIQSVNKHSKGSWTYSDHVLHLKYIKPDTIRHFKIKKLSAATLEMEENGVVFKFVKVD